MWFADGCCVEAEVVEIVCADLIDVWPDSLIGRRVVDNAPVGSVGPFWKTSPLSYTRASRVQPEAKKGKASEKYKRTASSVDIEFNDCARLT